MGEKTKPVALLIDGDILCYRAAATIEARTVEVKHIQSGRVKVFDTRTQFKDFLKAKDFVYKTEDYEFTDIQTPQDVSHATYIVKNQISKLKNRFEPELVHIVLGGKNNFRDKLALIKQYKSNRKDFLRPVHLQKVREYLLKVHGAEAVDNHEADDAVVYYGYEYLQKGYDVIICSQDKDALAYSGLKVYDFTKEDTEPLLISDFGELHLNVKDEVKGSGFLWYCHQMLIGDATDFYRPFEVAGIKYGEKTAYKVLKDCKTKQEALEAVISEYRRVYPSEVEYIAWDGSEVVTDYVGMLQLLHKCVRMMETPDDVLDFVKFAERFGVKL
jgi:5'-3' exonuclease